MWCESLTCDCFSTDGAGDNFRLAATAAFSWIYNSKYSKKDKSWERKSREHLQQIKLHLSLIAGWGYLLSFLLEDLCQSPREELHTTRQVLGHHTWSVRRIDQSRKFSVSHSLVDCVDDGFDSHYNAFRNKALIAVRQLLRTVVFPQLC